LVDALIEEVRTGKVVSLVDFGAFVEIAPETDGLCHVSELSNQYVDRVDDYVKMGDEIKVKVILIDDQGRIKLSRKEAMKELGESDPEPVGAPAGGGGEGGDRGPRRDFRHALRLHRHASRLGFLCRVQFYRCLCHELPDLRATLGRLCAAAGGLGRGFGFLHSPRVSARLIGDQKAGSLRVR
jgi:hypothetical protein